MKFPEHNQESGGGGTNVFIKMKDGDKIEGIFRGDPYVFHQHWVNNKSILCPGENQCPTCAAGEKAQFRFRLNFITKENDVLVAKIFEGNYGTFKDLREMHQNNYDLEETKVSVVRRGEKQQTRYNILPVKNNGGLTADHFAKIAKIPLNNLSKDKKSKQPKEDVPVSMPDFGDNEDADLPF